MFIRVVGMLLIAALGLAAIVGFNTMTFTSHQVEVEPAPALEFDVDAAAARLAKAISYRTTSYQDPAEFNTKAFLGFHKFLRKSFPRVHETLELETVSELSLLYTWNGTDPSLKPIVLLAHFDVVPVAPGTEDKWVRGAFDELIEDGYIWGRGAMDDKVNVLALLETAEMLIAEDFQPARTIIFAFGHDEEVGGPNGAQVMGPLLAERGIEAEFVLDEGGVIVSDTMPGVDVPVAVIGVAEKGYVSLELRVEAEGGHSSQPPRETAVGTLSRAVHRLESNQMPAAVVGASKYMFEKMGPEMPFAMKMALANLWLFEPVVVSQLEASPATNAMIRTTTAPTIIHAGVKDNVLPAEAMAVVNFRILPGDTVDSVLEHANRVIRDERVSVKEVEPGRNPSAVSSPDAPSFKMLERTIRSVFPEVYTSPYLVVGGTDARNYEVISKNVYRFTPMKLQADDLPRIHGVNERVSVENYGQIIRFFRQLIQNSAA